MKKKNIRKTGISCILVFLFWTQLVLFYDVQPVGPNGSTVGFATWNSLFHRWTGVNMTLYTITDWLGLIPLAVCLMFAFMGFGQMIRRKSIFKVDRDILILGVYYVLVMSAFLFFEWIPVNYRPVLIEGVLETSYPSSTTLLVLAVMPTFMEQVDRRAKSDRLKRIVKLFVLSFSAFMVMGRLISGVHWFTDIVGGIILSSGLFCLFTGKYHP